MQLEEVTAEIRPRSDWEAVDLGFAMVRRNFWRCLVVWWLPLIVPLAVAGWFLREMPLLLAALFWWVKPAGSRMVLFELSRRLFGEKPEWKSVWREVPRVWARRFFYRFVWARFSPWLPVVLAVEDLEGLRGKAYRQRVGQLGRRGDGVVMWVYFLTDLTAAWLGISVFAIAVMLMPEGQGGAWQLAVESWDENQPMDIPLVIAWAAAACMMVSMSLTDLFVTGAGFGIYVNNRTWLEGWDVELAFKRLGQRLGKIAAVLLMGLFVFLPMTSRAAEEVSVREDEDVELMAEVKSHPDFEVHFVMERVPKETKSSSSSTPSWLERLFSGWNVPKELGMLFLIALGGLLLATLGWLLWRYRHAFLMRGLGGDAAETKATARVVMGMAVSTDSLPMDIPAAALALWRQGRKQEGLALLYRGTISKAIDRGGVEIQESDTEGDCLERVEKAGAAAHPGYFRGLTAAWMALAYAGREPAEVEVEALCRDWPFGERRGA